MSKRLFIAFRLPTELRNDLLVLEHKMKNNIDFQSVNWVKPDNMHITIAFLGQVEDRTVFQAEDVLKKISFRQVVIRGDKLSFFEKGGIPAIFHFGINDVGVLTDISKNVREMLSNSQINFDRKPFNPHITIARIKNGEEGEKMKEYAMKMEEIYYQKEYSINSIILYESRFSSSGPVYIQLFEKNQEV